MLNGTQADILKWKLRREIEEREKEETTIEPIIPQGVSFSVICEYIDREIQFYISYSQGNKPPSRIRLEQWAYEIITQNKSDECLNGSMIDGMNTYKGIELIVSQ